MGDRPPRQVSLVREQFPKEGWASALVGAVNQFSQEVVASLTGLSKTYKVVTFSTAADPLTSFPIDLPVDFAPLEVRVAMILSGTPVGPVTVLATNIMSGVQTLRVLNITGLAPNSTYSLRLALE